MSTLMTYSVLCTKKLKLVFNNYLTFKVFQVYKTVVYLQLTNTHTNMIAKVILTKTGQMNMGGYFKEKTAQLTEIDGFKYCYRVCYVGDSFDECFTSLEEAKARFA